MPNNPATYDSIYMDSAKYGCHYTESIYYPVWEEAVKHIEGRVLELGCGTGQFAQMISDTVLEPMYLGVDYSKEAIRQSKERNPEMNFLCADVFKTIIPIADTIVALELIEHIKDDLGLIRLFPKDKKIVFSVPNFEAANHYRCFKNKKEIRDRFTRIDIKLIKEFKLIKNKFGDANTIFLCIGRKK